MVFPKITNLKDLFQRVPIEIEREISSYMYHYKTEKDNLIANICPTIHLDGSYYNKYDHLVFKEPCLQYLNKIPILSKHDSISIDLYTDEYYDNNNDRFYSFKNMYHMFNNKSEYLFDNQFSIKFKKINLRHYSNQGMTLLSENQVYIRKASVRSQKNITPSDIIYCTLSMFDKYYHSVIHGIIINLYIDSKGIPFIITEYI